MKNLLNHEHILVSACLLGKPVRYDGKSKPLGHHFPDCMRSGGRMIPFCPEVAGGLPTPRPPAEIKGGDGYDVLVGDAAVMNVRGENLSSFFISGAEKALAICRAHGIGLAILTDLSPSCGSRQIYNGRFSGEKKAGVGITAALLRQEGIRVLSPIDISGYRNRIP